MSADNKRFKQNLVENVKQKYITVPAERLFYQPSSSAGITVFLVHFFGSPASSSSFQMALVEKQLPAGLDSTNLGKQIENDKLNGTFLTNVCLSFYFFFQDIDKELKQEIRVPRFIPEHQ